MQTPNWVWEAKTLDRISGQHFLPLSSVYSAYFLQTGAGGAKLEWKLDVFQSIRIVHAEFDTAIPSTTFWPIPQAGVTIQDMTARRPLAPRRPDTDTETTQTTEPILAAPLYNDSTVMTAAGITLSLAVLLIGIWLKQRAR